jgi:hypothetical protein
LTISLDLSLSFATFSLLSVVSAKEAGVQDSCVKKKKSRSKRRNIYCQIHNCYLDSVSRKYHLFATEPSQLQSRGMRLVTAQRVIDAHTTVSLHGEWLEAFWCDSCQTTTWYHIRRTSDRSYELSVAPDELWQSVGGVIHPNGNPSVGEFTRTSAKMRGYQGVKGFGSI